MGYVHRFRAGEAVELRDGTVVTLLESGHRPVIHIRSPERAAGSATQAEAGEASGAPAHPTTSTDKPHLRGRRHRIR